MTERFELSTADYPEHAKLMARKDEHTAIEHFLNWCEDTGVAVVNPDTDMAYRPADLIASYFGIDPKNFEAEKRAMIEALRTAQ